MYNNNNNNNNNTSISANLCPYGVGSSLFKVYAYSLVDWDVSSSAEAPKFCLFSVTYKYRRP